MTKNYDKIRQEITKVAEKLEKERRVIF